MRKMQKIQAFGTFLVCSLVLSGCWLPLQTQHASYAEFRAQSPTQIYDKAQKEYLAGKYNNVIKYLTALNRFYPENSNAESAHVRLIECYIQLDQFKDAVQASNTLIRLYPQTVYRQEIREKIALFQRRSTQEERFDLAILREPILVYYEGQSAEQIYKQGRKALLDGRYNTAIGIFTSLNKLHSDNMHYTEKAHAGLIECYIGLNQLEDAVQWANLFLQRYPKSAYYQRIARGQSEWKNQLNQAKKAQQEQILNRRLDSIQDRLQMMSHKINTLHNPITEVATLLRGNSLNQRLTRIENQLNSLLRRVGPGTQNMNNQHPPADIPPPYTP
jgi:outer membrane protein assembly factor BamD (BamD/ComL family)